MSRPGASSLSFGAALPTGALNAGGTYRPDPGFAGAGNKLLPRRHQAAWHRPDNPSHSTGRGTGTSEPEHKKGWNQSVMVAKNNVFPQRPMERELSKFSAISRFDYNFRAEKLPRAEVKGMPTFDKFHLDLCQGPARALMKDSEHFAGFSQKDTLAISQKMSGTMKGEMPTHPTLDGAANATATQHFTAESRWNRSTLVNDRDKPGRAIHGRTLAEFDAKARRSTFAKSATLRHYEGPVEMEARRTEYVRQLKSAKQFDPRAQDTKKSFVFVGDEERMAQIDEERERADDDWDGTITFKKKGRSSGVRTQWNYSGIN